jgi:hypothetical protein
MSQSSSPTPLTPEDERVRAMSDAALRYIAPMLCGSAERAELIRRRLEEKDVAK